MVSKCYLKKLSTRRFFPVSLPSSDNLVHFLGHTAVMNPFKYLIMGNWSSSISSEHLFYGWECLQSRTKQKLKIKVGQRPGTDVQDREEDWNGLPKVPSTGGHLGFTFRPSEWLGVSIPDIEIEFTGFNLLMKGVKALYIREEILDSSNRRLNKRASHVRKLCLRRLLEFWQPCCPSWLHLWF